MQTVTLTDSGFSFDLEYTSPNGHLMVNASDGGVKFILGSGWTGANPATVNLSTSVFKHSTVSVGSSSVAVEAAFKNNPSGQGTIKCDKPHGPSLDTMQGQIDVVPKGGGAED
jgi:hypothetical protein